MRAGKGVNEPSPFKSSPKMHIYKEYEDTIDSSFLKWVLPLSGRAYSCLRFHSNPSSLPPPLWIFYKQ